MFIFEIDLASSRFSRSSSQISDDEMSTEARRVGVSAQDPSGKIMTPWTFSVKFPYVTQFTFGSLMFAMGGDGDLKLLTRGPAPKQFTPIYGQAPYLLVDSSTSSEACTCLNPFVGSYHPTAKAAQKPRIGTSIFRLSARTSSSSSSGTSPDQDSTDDYPEIGVAYARTQQKRVASSSWWPRPQHLHETTPTSIPPSRDRKCLTLGHRMTG
jgi:hypothetical protein